MKSTTQYIECACSSNEHTLRFDLHDWDNEHPELYTSVFLHDYQSFWKRVWIAVKYIFGYKCKYGHWDCTIIRPEQAPELQLLLDKYIEAHNAWVAKLKSGAKKENE